MNETSMTASVTGSGNGSSKRMLARSIEMTRGSGAATTRAVHAYVDGVHARGSRCNGQSVKPPVGAPMSAQTHPTGVTLNASSAAASRPARLT